MAFAGVAAVWWLVVAVVGEHLVGAGHFDVFFDCCGEMAGETEPGFFGPGFLLDGAECFRDGLFAVVEAELLEFAWPFRFLSGDPEGDPVVVPVAMRAFGCSGGSTVGRTRLV